MWFKWVKTLITIYYTLTVPESKQTSSGHPHVSVLGVISGAQFFIRRDRDLHGVFSGIFPGEVSVGVPSSLIANDAGLPLFAPNKWLLWLET